MKTKNPGLILIANYNQAQEIGKFLKECLAVLPAENLLVVDDGSQDGSDQIAEQMGLRVLRHEHNRGIGAAIRTGIDEADRLGVQWVLISSSNGKMIPSEFPSIYGPVDAGSADYIQGSRFLGVERSPGLPSFRRWAIPVFSSAVSLLLGRRFTDATCGLRAYRIDFLKNSRVDIHQDWLNRYELEYYIHYQAVKLGLRIEERPVTIRYDHLAEGRHSKIRPIVGWWSMIRPFVLLTLKLKR